MNWLTIWGKLRRGWFLKSAIVVVVGLGAFGRFLGGVDRTRMFLNEVLCYSIRVSPHTGEITLKAGFIWAVLTACSLFIVGIMGFVDLYGRVRKAEQEKGRLEEKERHRDAIVRKTFEGMMLAASKICDQIYPTERIPKKNLLSARCVYLVKEDFTTTVMREYEIKAIDDVHFEQYVVGAEQEADPCELIDEINFKVGDADPLNRVAYLPTENTPYSKKIAVFFLPRISPGEPVARKICITYTWPRMLRALEIKGVEVGEWILYSRDPVPYAELSMYFAPKFGGKVSCDIHGKSVKGEGLDEVACDIPGYSGWKGWRYTLKDAQAGTYKVALRLRQPA